MTWKAARGRRGVLWMLAATLAAAAHAQAPAVRLTPSGGGFDLEASFRTSASSGVVWAVLTDYAGLPGFVPSMRSSRVLERTPEGAWIEQEAVAHWFIFRRRVTVRLRVRELPPTRLVFREEGGEAFRLYEGEWTLESLPDGTQVDYRLRAEPSTALPAALARSATDRAVTGMLESLRLEMERRAATRPPAGGE